jgi:Ankyrin repeat
MSDKYVDYKFPGVPPARQIDPLRSIAEEKGTKVPGPSFAERVNALPEHDRKKIEAYLRKKVIENLSQKEQNVLLGKAMERNDPAAVEILADCGAEVNKTYRGGAYTPLIESCEFAHVKVVEALLTKGADPNILPEGGNQWSALHCCAPIAKAYKGKKDRKLLDCTRLLLDHGADVNLKTILTKRTPLHLVNEHAQGEFATLLLSRGADPLAKDAAGQQPKLRAHHFQGLGPHITEALQQGQGQQVDRWILAVANLLPDPKAASLLVEWAPLCSAHEALAEAIHSGIEHFLTMIDGDPPVEVLRYVACHNARETREEVLSKLKVAELTPVGMRDEFGIIGNYSPAEHGLLLIELASSWAQDPTEDHMVHVMAILKFVAATAAGAPRPVRVALHNEAVKLQSELFNNAVPELVERASSVRDFLGQGPFALDKLE